MPLRWWQYWLGKRAAKEAGWPRLSNLVFMGMGEPANNLPAVGGALEMLTAEASFRLSRRAIVVSTVAPSPVHIAALSALPAKLAWSVHAARDPMRRALVPTTRHSMVELRDAFLAGLATRSTSGMRGLLCEVRLG